MPASTNKPIRCACCGAAIDDIPTDFATAAPWRRVGVTDSELAARVKLTRDTCIVDGKTFFIRGNIELPIFEAGDSFAWGVWCSLSRKSFDRIMELWDDPDGASEPPFAETLYADLPGYAASTWLLAASVQLRDDDQVPLVVLKPGCHPMADEQSSGISVERWHALVKAAMDSSGPKSRT